MAAVKHELDAPSDDDAATQYYKKRTIKSCTNCRIQKVRCDAAQTHPAPCTKCQKRGKVCRIDPDFKAPKPDLDHLESLRNDVSVLKKKMDEVLHTRQMGPPGLEGDALASVVGPGTTANQRQPSPSPMMLHSHPESSSSFTPANDVTIATDITESFKTESPTAGSFLNKDSFNGISADAVQAENAADGQDATYVVSKFTLGDVTLSLEQANRLHAIFIADFLPYLPIMQSRTALELRKQSKLLFWTVILVASQAEPHPHLYNKLCKSVRALVTEICWINTPRSAHIIQALLILSCWPLPNEKLLDDCSVRFVEIAKTLGMQLGLHRGKFFYEFSRSQATLPDAEKWRTRSWCGAFFMDQVWAAHLGLPLNMPVDHLIETAQSDSETPRFFRALLILSIFYSRLITLVGKSTTTPDGLMAEGDRCAVLSMMEQQVISLATTLGILDPVANNAAQLVDRLDSPAVEIYYLHVRLMICAFAFLPGTPMQEVTPFVVNAFHCATRIVTKFTKLNEARQVIEFPIYVRQAASYSALVLFRLHVSPLLYKEYVESARQSVVTIHRLYRNMLTAWKDVENDISRTAKILEKLNIVIVTHPYLFSGTEGILTRMRSHLTASLLYELIWSVHEARRQYANKENGNVNDGNIPKELIGPAEPVNKQPSFPPLPFYNQITRDDFRTSTTVTPNGTTVTTLVPTRGKPSPTNQGQSVYDNVLWDSTGAINDNADLDTLMQGIDWVNNDDGTDEEFLGWTLTLDAY